MNPAIPRKGGFRCHERRNFRCTPTRRAQLHAARCHPADRRHTLGTRRVVHERHDHRDVRTYRRTRCRNAASRASLHHGERGQHDLRQPADHLRRRRRHRHGESGEGSRRAFCHDCFLRHAHGVQRHAEDRRADPRGRYDRTLGARRHDRAELRYPVVSDGRLRRHHRRHRRRLAAQQVPQDRAAERAVVLRRLTLRAHHLDDRLPLRRHRHVLRLAARPAGHLRARRPRDGHGLHRHADLRHHQARSDPLWPAPRLLSAVLADGRRRLDDDRRPARPGRSEHFLRPARFARCHAFQLGCDALLLGRVHLHDLRPAGRGARYVPLCASREEEGRGRPLALGGSDLDAHGHHRADRVLLPLRRTRALRRAGRARRRRLHDRAHPQHRRRPDILGRSPRPLHLRHPAGRGEDGLDVHHPGRCRLLLPLLLHLLVDDPSLRLQDAGPRGRRRGDEALLEG